MTQIEHYEVEVIEYDRLPIHWKTTQMYSFQKNESKAVQLLLKKYRRNRSTYK